MIAKDATMCGGHERAASVALRVAKIGTVRMKRAYAAALVVGGSQEERRATVGGPGLIDGGPALEQARHLGRVAIAAGAHQRCRAVIELRRRVAKRRLY